MNLNINYKDFVLNKLPHFIRGDKMVNFIYSLITPLQTLNDEFYDYAEIQKEKIRYNGRTIWLEKRLNDLYDGTLRRIYIQNKEVYSTYLFNKLELLTAPYVYNKWKITTTYTAGQFVSYERKIYECILGNTGQLPTDPTYWTEDSDVTYLYNKTGGTLATDFIVHCPAALVTQEISIQGTVEMYKIYEKTYSINYF